MPRVRVAVIGAGNMGRNHVRTYAALKNVELLAIADIDPSASKLASQYGIRYYKDYKTMLEKEKPDAVSVVVPTPFHYPIGRYVIDKKIHCLIEKPIASTPEEADKLIKAAAKTNIVFTVGHIEHYNPMVQKLKKLVDNKEIGDITSIVVKRVGGFPVVEPKTDVIIDLAVHDIEIINYLMGQLPKNIYGHGSKTLHSSKIDAAELLMTYEGASGFIQVSWITPVKIRTIAITGSDGYVEGNYITQELTHYKQNMRQVKNGFKNFVITLGKPQKRTLKPITEEPLKNELNAFIKAIQSGNNGGLVSPKSAREALKIALEAIEKYEVKK